MTMEASGIVLVPRTDAGVVPSSPHAAHVSFKKHMEESARYRECVCPGANEIY